MHPERRAEGQRRRELQGGSAGEFRALQCEGRQWRGEGVPTLQTPPVQWDRCLPHPWAVLCSRCPVPPAPISRGFGLLEFCGVPSCILMSRWHLPTSTPKQLGLRSESPALLHREPRGLPLAQGPEVFPWAPPMSCPPGKEMELPAVPMLRSP